MFENGIAASNQIYGRLAGDIGAERIEHVTQVLEDLIAALNTKHANGRVRHLDADAGLDARE